MKNQPTSRWSLLAITLMAVVLSQHGWHCSGQQQQMVTSQLGANGNGNVGSGQTLVISQNANGGIRVVDQTNQRVLVNTDSLQLNQNVGESEGADNNGLVAGLLEWIEEKKRKKKEKKDKEKLPIILPIPMPQPMPQPMPMPMPPHRQERKEIHIHINNHIKKDHKKPHKKHEKHSYHYEDYHDGHDGHDKYYHGKHSFPLLGHHMSFDYYDHSSGDHGHHLHGHDHHGGGSGHDDYSGYESRGVAQYVANSKESTATKTKRVANKNEAD